MKTVLAFDERSGRKEQALFYHDQRIHISKELRPVPAHWNASTIKEGVEVPITEMMFFVLRFPRAWRNRIHSDAFNFCPVKVWNPVGDKLELWLQPNSAAGSVFSSLADSGFFRFTEKLSPLPDEGLYLPYYQSPVRFWQTLSNGIGVALSIPKTTWLMDQDRKKQAESPGEKPETIQ